MWLLRYIKYITTSYLFETLFYEQAAKKLLYKAEEHSCLQCNGEYQNFMLKICVCKPI